LLAILGDTSLWPIVAKECLKMSEINYRANTLAWSAWSALGLLFVLTFGHPRLAEADWGLAGVQYSCDGKLHSFELLPYDRSSSDPPEGIPLKEGFTEITEGHPSITCKLGNHTLKGQIDVSPPAARGQCMGGGFVRARSLSVSDVELLPDAPAFNFDCPGVSGVLIRIRVAAKNNSLTVERCYDEDQSGGEIHKAHCDSKELDIDALVSAKAVLSHNLANDSVQASSGVAHLPSENDFASVFQSSDPGDHSIPTCAHGKSVVPRFGNPIVGFVASTPHGRVAGKVGDRIYIHPANPQICDSVAEPQCRAKSYLIPGDRVDVGFVCGQWTYIQFPAPTNASGSIYGWIETGRLYEIDSLVTPNPKLWADYWTANIHKDPLVDAVAHDDLARVKQLIAVASDQKNLDLNRALRIAISGQDLDVVNVLLTTSVDVKTDCRPVIDAAVFSSQPVLDALTKAGLDLSCYKDALLMVAGMDRINGVISTLSGWGSWVPVRDLPSRAHELIAAGIPVDWSRPSGKTALIATIAPNNVDVAQVLLKAGANPNVVLHDDANSADGHSGASALIQAIVAYPQYLDPTMVRLLLEGGANPNYRTAGEYRNGPDDAPGIVDPLAGVTALHLTAENGNLALTKLLLEHGADPHLTRSDGALAADIATQNGHPRVAALIETYLVRH
jgi:Ankyrin repeats (many copies)